MGSEGERGKEGKNRPVVDAAQSEMLYPPLQSYLHCKNVV